MLLWREVQPYHRLLWPVRTVLRMTVQTGKRDVARHGIVHPFSGSDSLAQEQPGTAAPAGRPHAVRRLYEGRPRTQIQPVGKPQKGHRADSLLCDHMMVFDIDVNPDRPAFGQSGRG